MLWRTTRCDSLGSQSSSKVCCLLLLPKSAKLRALSSSAGPLLVPRVSRTTRAPHTLPPFLEAGMPKLRVDLAPPSDCFHRNAHVHPCPISTLRSILSITCPLHLSVRLSEEKRLNFHPSHLVMRALSSHPWGNQDLIKLTKIKPQSERQVPPPQETS